MLQRELAEAHEAALEAGDILRREFHRPGGPRGRGGHCVADAEAERVIRDRLETAFPDYGFRGEELRHRDHEPRKRGAPTWVIDPNDGTAAFLQGWRGAAVSVALVRSARPALGVVYAHSARAGRGDEVSWAEGADLRRNGSTLSQSEAPWESAPATVLVSQAADLNSCANALLCAPMRFRVEPGIAWRLALVAAGEGRVGTSLNAPTDWDVAAGHALLRGAGGDLLGSNERSISYGFVSPGDCFGGDLEAACELSRRDWSKVFERSRADKPLYDLVTPDPRRLCADHRLLSRAQGCLVGQIAGDNLGGLVEFSTAAEVAARFPKGPRDLEDGGCWNTLAGQPTDDSEMALMLARSIVAEGRYDVEAAARAYAWWHESGPFDCGVTTSAALGPAARALRQGGSAASAARAGALRHKVSEANGALMRVAPLAVWGHGLPDSELAELARTDATLTHANRVCQDASALFCVAVAAALRGAATPRDVYEHALGWGRASGLGVTVLDAVTQAETAPPRDFQHQMGWVLIALQNAFFRLLREQGPVAGLARTVLQGGDTDTNAAIAGALLGAFHGVEAFPAAWIDRLLTCRPMPETPGCRTPRPRAFWPVDCLILAERLAASG